MSKANPCNGCIYQGQLYGDLTYCSYIFNVGKPRPCPGGEGCTAKTTNKELKEKKKAERKNQAIEQKKAKAEYNRAYREKKKAEKIKACRRCGKLFVPSAEQRCYCSVACANAQDAENRKKWDAQKWQKKKAEMKAAKKQKEEA